MRDRCYILEQQKELSGATSGQQTSIEDSSRLDRIFPSEVPREGKSAFAGKRCLSVFTLCFTSDRPETFRAACNGAISAANENISILGGGGHRSDEKHGFFFSTNAGPVWPGLVCTQVLVGLMNYPTYCITPAYLILLLLFLYIPELFPTPVR